MLFLNKFIDATVLGPAVDTDKVTGLAEDAQTHQYASICIPPYFIKEIKTSYPELNVCTVIGFPQGISVQSAKADEISRAIDDGADELDIVVNLTAIANDNLALLDQEMEALLAVKQNKLYKIIIESALWTDAVLARVVQFYSKYDIEYLKTSTGFNTDGASENAVKIISENKAETIKIKASGGIKTYKQAVHYIDMGVSRIGTSSPQNLLKPNTDEN